MSLNIMSFILFLFSSLLVSEKTFSEETQKALVNSPIIKKMSLLEIIKASEKLNLEILETAYQVTKYQRDEDQARASFNPKFNLKIGVGPINKAYGNAVSSTNSNVAEIGNWRALFIASAQGQYALYTWGRRRNYINAAKSGQNLARAEVTAKKNLIRMKIKEIYYGILLSRNFLAFVEDGINDVELVIEKMIKKKYNKSDLYRLKIFLNQLNSKKIEIQNKQELALAGLKLYSGLKSEKIIVPQESWLKLKKRPLKEIKHYQNLFIQNRPELKQLEAGINAKKSLAKAKSKENYPNLGLLLKYDFSYTDARQKQDSVFAYDPYNENSLIVGLGVTWDIDWGLTKAKFAKTKVEIAQLKTKKKYAEKGLLIKVFDNWNTLNGLQDKLNNSKKANRFGKKLLARAMIGGSLGLIKGKDIVEAYQMRAFTYKDHLENIYHYNLAWAELSQSVGTEVDPALNRL